MSRTSIRKLIPKQRMPESRAVTLDMLQRMEGPVLLTDELLSKLSNDQLAAVKEAETAADWPDKDTATEPLEPFDSDIEFVDALLGGGAGVQPEFANVMNLYLATASLKPSKTIFEDAVGKTPALLRLNALQPEVLESVRNELSAVLAEAGSSKYEQRKLLLESHKKLVENMQAILLALSRLVRNDDHSIHMQLAYPDKKFTEVEFDRVETAADFLKY